MKSASAAVLNILNGTAPILRADLYTITTRGGTIIRLTSADINQTVGGNLFTSGPAIVRSMTKQSVGVAIDSVKISLHDANQTLVAGLPIVQQFRLGLFDYATVKIEKLFLSSWSDLSPGTVPWFEGRVSDVSCEKMTVNFTVKDLLEILDQQMPPYVYQPPCVHSTYDAGCGLAIASYTFAYTAASGSTANTFNLTGTAKADGYYALGKIKFTSGANAGQSRSIKSYISGVAVVFNPFPFVPAIGDACSLTAGDDKLQGTCSAKFGNLSRFRGYPYIPVPETAIEGGGVGGAISQAGSTGTPGVGSSISARTGGGTYVQ